MCVTCGCSDSNHSTLTDLATGEHIHLSKGHRNEWHHHVNEDPASHSHTDTSSESRRIVIEESLLQKNDDLAKANREWFVSKHIRALNLVSSPGAGKTTLLERTLRDRNGDMEFSIIEGDQHTTRDAERIQSAGGRVLQINTASICHLDAEMISRALERLAPRENSILFIENVGNLVCPALFDLGEENKIVISSITEGEDKPLKYPYMFRAAKLVLLNKIDLLPHLDFELGMFEKFLNQVNPHVTLIPVSAKSGEGLSRWYDWLSAF